ncbi:hypothetical protein X727_12465 [Mesorhizobium sp. L103C119B0]|nr:hypothetical protein X727_12465 [Mesorhizobium sp. L103C119B0]
MNTHATVNFPSGIAEDKASIYIAKTIKNLRQWLRRRGISGAQTTHLWVRERRPDQASHVHLLFHLPLSARLTNSRFAALIPREAGIVLGEVPDRAGRDSGTPVLVLRAKSDEQTREWTRYVLKGISALDANDFGLRPARQGPIAGKRVGVAENIGASEWTNWTTDYRIGGREFALQRWRERAEAAKRVQARTGPA